MILLDTDICVEILRGNPAMLRKKEAYPDVTAVSFMTAAELHYGAAFSGYPEASIKAVEAFLSSMNVLRSSDSVMRSFGTIKAGLRRKRILIPDADLFIGATAVAHGVPLVTGNTKHFSRIESLELEDWTR